MAVKKFAICCLWMGADLPGFSAGVFRAADVLALQRGLERHTDGADLVALTDGNFGDIDGVSCRRFASSPPGWAKMCEAWRPDLWPGPGERAVLFNLDLVLVGDCNWLWEWDEAPIGLPADPYATDTVANPVMSYNRDGAALLWSEYRASIARGMAEDREMGVASEMALLRRLWAHHQWPLLEPHAEKLLSYKAHAKEGGWEAASVVYLHGRPKMHEIANTNPLKRLWLA